MLTASALSFVPFESTSLVYSQNSCFLNKLGLIVMISYSYIYSNKRFTEELFYNQKKRYLKRYRALSIKSHERFEEK